MAFEVIPAGQFMPVAPLESGEISIAKNGGMTIRVDDLEMVGIKKYAMVLADPETLRIGLRSVRDGEQQASLAASVITRKGGADSGRRRINITRAVKRLGLTIEAVAGRYTLNVHQDELLFVTLTEAKDIPAKE